MRKSDRRRDEVILPPPERGQHDAVEQVVTVVTDESGRSQRTRPYQIVGLMERMRREGAISPAMLKAGERYRDLFRVAQLDALRAGDVGKPVVDGGRRSTEMGVRVEGARNAVWRATLALGGLSSPGGSCVWHVIGLETSLSGWATSQGWGGKKVNNHAAKGIFVASLGVLERHFEGE